MKSNICVEYYKGKKQQVSLMSHVPAHCDWIQIASELKLFCVHRDVMPKKLFIPRTNVLVITSRLFESADNASTPVGPAVVKTIVFAVAGDCFR